MKGCWVRRSCLLFQLARFFCIVLAVITVGPLPAQAIASDIDGDGVEDTVDVCPSTPDPDQVDSNGDGIGDVCAPFCLPVLGDVTGNGTTDIVDAQCTILVSLWQLAGQPGLSPGCLAVAPEQADVDCTGDVAVTDVLLVISAAFELTLDPLVDNDTDGCPDLCSAEQPDFDDDSVPDNFDNCLTVPNPDQADADFDDAGDVCDGCPSDPAKKSVGTCGCGFADADSDSDGLADCVDACDDTSPVVAVVGGASVPVPMAAGTPGCVSFDAVAGKRLSVAMVSNLGGCIHSTVYTPTGAILFGTDFSCSVTTFTDLLITPTTGTYQLHIAPTTAATGVITVTVYDVPPDLMLTGSLGGGPVVAPITTPAQNAAVTFEATVGTRASFRSVGSPTKCTRYTLIAPDGSTVLGPQLECSAEFFSELLILSQAGTYTLWINPDETAITTYTVQGFIAPPDVEKTVTPGGAAAVLNMNVPAQNGFVEFFATTGDRISVVFQTSPLICRTLSITKPSGGTQIAPSLQCSATEFVDVFVVTETGLYSVFVNPKGSATANETVAVHLVPDDPIVVVVPGAPSFVMPLSVPGLNGFVEFDGAPGQRVSVSATRTPSGCVRFGLDGPVGTLFAPQLECGNYFSDLVVLPDPGTYSFSIDPNGPYVGTHTIQVFSVPADVTVPTTIGGSSVNVVNGTPAQNGFVTFLGTAGANIAIVASHTSGGCISHRLKTPSGTTMFGPQLTCGTLTTPTLILPADGEYSFVVDPSTTFVGTTTVTVQAK